MSSPSRNFKDLLIVALTRLSELDNIKQDKSLSANIGLGITLVKGFPEDLLISSYINHSHHKWDDILNKNDHLEDELIKQGTDQLTQDDSISEDSKVSFFNFVSLCKTLDSETRDWFWEVSKHMVIQSIHYIHSQKEPVKVVKNGKTIEGYRKNVFENVSVKKESKKWKVTLQF